MQIRNGTFSIVFLPYFWWRKVERSAVIRFGKMLSSEVVTSLSEYSYEANAVRIGRIKTRRVVFIPGYDSVENNGNWADHCQHCLSFWSRYNRTVNIAHRHMIFLPAKWTTWSIFAVKFHVVHRIIVWKLTSFLSFSVITQTKEKKNSVDILHELSDHVTTDIAVAKC